MCIKTISKPYQNISKDIKTYQTAFLIGNVLIWSAGRLQGPVAYQNRIKTISKLLKCF